MWPLLRNWHHFICFAFMARSSSQLTGVDHSTAASSPLVSVLGIIDAQASLLSENICTPVTNLHRLLGFLKLDEVYKLQINKFMYQLQYKTLPYVFYEKFTKISSVYNHNTRLNNSLIHHQPRINERFTKNQISYRGAKHLE